MILLDTDILIEILERKSARGDWALQQIRASGDSIGITAINLHEILYGLAKYAKPVQAVSRLPVFSFTDKDAQLAARIELETERGGQPIPRADAMIAAVAINQRASLFTLDRQHFTLAAPFGLRLFP